MTPRTNLVTRPAPEKGLLGNIASGNHLSAQNDEPEPDSREAALIAADRHNESLKQSGELERRRIERAGLSLHEQQMRRDLP